MSPTKERALQAFSYLLDLDKFSLNNVSADFLSETTGYFYVRIKSDKKDEGEYYNGEELIRLAKREGWNG